MKVNYKLPFTLVSFICITLLIKFSLPDYKNYKQQKKEFWIKKTHDGTRKNIIVAGDSRTYRGVSTAKILAELGEKGKELSAANLGYSSAGFGDNYLDYIDQRIQKNTAEKRLIILGLTPWSLTAKACINEQYEQYKAATYIEQFKAFYLNNYINFEPYKPTEFWEISQHPSTSDFYNNQEYYEQFHTDGWIASYRLPLDSMRAVGDYTKVFTESKIDPARLEAVFQKVETWIGQGIKVIAFRPPTTYAMENLEDSLSGYDEQTTIRKLRKLGVDYLETNNEDFLSYDGSHLHYESAESLSKQLGILSKKTLN
ncbi:MAG: hypothetical protein MK212_14670 [Saprospiraceae bacterium]|nr:hypothetical protein [Saprospiraceae bacterium]